MELSFNTLQAPRLEYRVKKIKKSAWGSCVYAEAEARGDAIFIDKLFDQLNKQVTISDGPDVVWWGHLHSVTALGFSSSLSHVANAVRCIYEGVDGGDNILSEWAIDDDSIERYGRREKVLSGAASKSEADKIANSYLSMWSKPKEEPTWSAPSATAKLTFRGEWSRLDQLHAVHKPVLSLGITDASATVPQKIGLSPLTQSMQITDSDDDRLISSDLPEHIKDEQVWISGSQSHDGLWLVKDANETEIFFTEKMDQEAGVFTIGPDGHSVWQEVNPDIGFYLNEIKIKARKLGNDIARGVELKVSLGAAGPNEAGLARVVGTGSISSLELDDEFEWCSLIFEKHSWMPSTDLWLHVFSEKTDTHRGFAIEVDSKADKDRLIIEDLGGVARSKPSPPQSDDEENIELAKYSLLFELKGAVSVIEILNEILTPLFTSVSIELEDSYTSKTYDGSKTISKIVEELLTPYNNDSSRVVTLVTQSNRLFISLKSKPIKANFRYDATERIIKNSFDIALPHSRCLSAEWIESTRGVRAAYPYWVDSAEYDGKAWKPVKTYSIFDER